MKMNFKTIPMLLALSISVNLNAIDDVSIMDLKEVVYIVIKENKTLKKEIIELRKEIEANTKSIKMQDKEILALKKSLKNMRNGLQKDIASNKKNIDFITEIIDTKKMLRYKTNKSIKYHNNSEYIKVLGK